MSKLLECLQGRAIQASQGCALQGDVQRLDWVTLWSQIEQLADRLRQTGWQRVGLMGDNSPAWVVADLACLRAGVVNVPIPGFFSADQQSHVMQQGALDGLVITDGETACVMDAIQLRGLAPAAKPTALPPGTVKVTFTSGSTGQPKGVCLSAANLDRTAEALRDRVGMLGIRRHLCVLPLATLLENVAGVYLALWLGAEVVLPSLRRLGMQGSSQVDPRALAAGLQSLPADSMILVPELARLLVTLVGTAGLTLARLKFVAVGGARVAPGLLGQAHALGIPLYEGYGLSECGSVVALNTPLDERAGSVGRVLEHVNVECDAQGQVWVSGNTHLGYLGASTVAEERWATGDLGRLDDDGYLSIQGRSKNILITAFGRNVSPEWIESEVLDALPVQQALVWGEGEPRLSVLVYAAPSVSDRALGQALRALNKHLPDYAQPHTLYRLPEPLSTASGYLTQNGRIKRQTLLAALPQLLATTQSIPMHNAGDSAMSFFDRLQQETAEARQHVTNAPIIEAIRQNRLDREGYIHFLTQAYHHVKHTAPLMMACGGRLPERLEFVRKALVEYIEEEYGHHEWILNDIRAAGGNPEATRHGRPGAPIEWMVAYLYDQIYRGNPMTLFGMVQVLEGTSVALATPLGQCLQRQLGLPNQAFSYLYSHGSLDLEHYDFFKDLMNQVTDAEDQQAIIEGARQVYRLYGDMLRSIPLRQDVEGLQDAVA